ncbi:MAG: hypothetical protein MR270_01925, partial [Erysipelotrichaceae bacterium]|nr:hypothetical protein [Erysipelotrichaceae bacterium]
TSNFIKDQFDAKIGNSKISDTFASYDNKDLKWKITIDYSKLDVEDKDILMIYYYTFNDGASSWKRYEKVDDNGVASLTELTSSSFILNGGLVYGNNPNNVSDANLFVYLYNLFNVNNETISTSSTLTDYVISNDWFNFNKVIDISMLTSISNFNGIQHFVNVQKAIFSNVSLDSTSIDYISQMKGLEDLNMSKCNLSDSSTLSKLSSLSKLHILDVSNNTIDDFSFLLNISSLTSVSLYNNNETKTYLGSKGMSNYYVYDDLKRQGIVVYYQLNSNNVPVSFDESTELNDYQRLKSIEYQSIINVGDDITTLYAPFEELNEQEISEIFNIASGSLTWSYGGGSNANDATYFSVTWSDGTNTMIVKFYVDRQ